MTRSGRGPSADVPWSPAHSTTLSLTAPRCLLMAVLPGQAGCSFCPVTASPRRTQPSSLALSRGPLCLSSLLPKCPFLVVAAPPALPPPHPHYAPSHPSTLLPDPRGHLFWLNWRIPGSRPCSLAGSPILGRKTGESLRRNPCGQGVCRGTRSGQEAPEDRGCGETRTEGKAKEQSQGQRQRGQQGGIWGRPRQGHMGLVIPLVTCGMTGWKREKGRAWAPR